MGAFYTGHYHGKLAIKVAEPAHPLTACLAGQDYRVWTTSLCCPARPIRGRRSASC